VPLSEPDLTSTVSRTSTPAASITHTPANTPIPPSATIPVSNNPLESQNDVQVLYMDTFDDPLGSEWNIYAGTIENGVMEIIGNENWNGASRNGEFGENQGVVIDFNYSTDSLSEIFVEHDVWNTDQYRRFGVYIGSNQAQVNEYDGKNDHGGANLFGNLTLKPDRTYSLLIAILPNRELLEVIWDPSNASETLSYREKFDETWAGLTWTLWIGVNQGIIQFDNFNEIRFSGAK